MGSFFKPPKPKEDAREKQLEVRQRRDIADLTREENAKAKNIKRGSLGRKRLLGSGSELGLRPGLGGGGVRGGARGGGSSRSPGGGGGLLSSGGGAAASAGGSFRFSAGNITGIGNR